MRNIFLILFGSLAITSCYTDEPPTVRNDLIGTWQVVSIYGYTYQEVPDWDNYIYKKEIIWEDSLKTFDEEFTFHESGVYQVGFDTAFYKNDMLAFAFTYGNVNIDSSRRTVFGIWEEFINGNVEYIIHFDQRVNNIDPFMIVEEVTEESLTLVMDLNNFNDQDGKALLKPTANYQGARTGHWMANTADNNSTNGSNFGWKMGFYEGYNDNYTVEDNNFIRVYGSNYIDFFNEKWGEKTRTTDDMDQAYIEGKNQGYLKGKEMAQIHINGLNKGFQLVYNFKKIQ